MGMSAMVVINAPLHCLLVILEHFSLASCPGASFCQWRALEEKGPLFQVLCALLISVL